VTPLAQLRTAVADASAALRPADKPAGTAPTVERPKREGFGDYSTNAAMLLAPSVGAPPRELAERLGEAIQQRLGDGLDRYEVAGPGFLNLFLADSWHAGALAHVLELGDAFGGGQAATPERIYVDCPGGIGGGHRLGQLGGHPMCSLCGRSIFVT